MKTWPAFLLFSIATLPIAVLAEEAVTDYPVTYEGGSLPLNHNKVRATLGRNEVIFVQHGQRIAVPAKNITEISCSTEGRRRSAYYVGVTWTTGSGSTAPAQVLLKLSRGEYHEFLAALEQLTGIKAVNTDQVPTVVHYDLS